MTKLKKTYRKVVIFPIKVGGLKTTCHQDLLVNLVHYTIVRYKQESKKVNEIVA